MENQWEYFFKKWLAFIGGYYKSRKEIITINGLNTTTMTELDTFYVYKIIAMKDQIEKTPQTLYNALNSHFKEVTEVQATRAIAQWLSNQDFKVLVRWTFGKEEEIDDIEPTFTRIENLMYGDYFMETLMNDSFLSIYDSGKKIGGGDILRDTLNLEKLLAHQKRNINWLWFLCVSFFFMNNIYLILERSTLRDSFFDILLKDKDVRFYLDYPISYFTYTLRYILSNGDLKENKGDTIFKDDISHLMYLVFDPQNTREAIKKTEFRETMTAMDITNSVLMRIKNHYNSNEDVNDKTKPFFRRIMKLTKDNTPL